MTFLMQTMLGQRSNYPVLFEGTGFGAEAQIIREKEQSVVRHFVVPVSRRTTNPYIKFETNKVRWKKETKYYSSVEKIAMHPSYQKIIGMGMDVVPFILRDLSKEPNQWFWALKAITDTDPVPVEDRGRVRKMVAAWLKWGRENGIV